MIEIEKILEINKLKEKMVEYAYTDKAKEEIMKLEPLYSELDVLTKLRETTEAKLILEKIGTPPLTSLDGMKEYMEIAQMGACLTAEQLEKIAVILTTIRRMKDFLNRCKVLEISLPYYEENLDSLDEIREKIHQMIRGGKVDDNATKLLKSLRNKIEVLETKIREKAEAILRANKAYLSDQFCTVRNGRTCIPVKKEYKLKIKGTLIDQSATGNTLFIEPSAVAKLSEELELLKLEEENEERRILYTLTDCFADKAEIFEENKKTIEKLDFMFAKGKLSIEINGTEPKITMEREISIVNGRHPLLEEKICVPLNFEIGNGTQGIIITGPNTGGKTVAIKTVGLFCYMVQCGLHISCEQATIGMNSQILCDIGDGQNLSENLSTFSAHITNVLQILKKVNRESLVILDELGSGTDPTEGMGIAIAILEELKKSGCLFLVTTHYPEVKNYGEVTEGIMNARMAFERESLKPLYQLEIGKAGESCAFYIAKRLGMPGNMLKRAFMAAYQENKKVAITTDFGKKKKSSEVEQVDLEGMEIDENETLIKEQGRKLIKKNRSKSNKEKVEEYHVGDSVLVYPEKKIGIVCETANENGMLRVQVAKKKIWINHKRVKLQVAAAELYPEEYDFSIVFDSVEQRKARHLMERKYTKEVELHIEKEEQ